MDESYKVEPRLKLHHRLSVLALALGVIALPVGAAAQASPPAAGNLDPGKFKKRFAALPMTQGMKPLMAFVEKNLRARYAERIAGTPDQHDRDRLKAEIEMRVQAIRDSHIEFKGQKTGYNVSVVAGDFAHNTGETMVVAPVDRSRDYYFFVQGGLWKLVTAEAASRNFAAFLVNLSQVYGPAKTIEYSSPDSKDDPVRATWEAGELLLEARARPDYGTITISWSRKDIAGRIAELRGGAKPPEATASDGLDPTILDIMKD